MNCKDKAVLKLDWATAESAKYACLNWHYSKSLPVGKTVKVGAWEDGRFIGVVMFAWGANRNIGAPYDLDQVQVCELVRVALRDHQHAVSRIMAISLAFLHKHSPGLRLVVSYADTGQGHHGGIYQAGNWIYTGTGGADVHMMLDGVKTHPRSVWSKFGTRSLEKIRALGHIINECPATAKHKYLMPLDKEMAAKVAGLAKGYPKKETADTRMKKQDARHHLALGGAVPTHALHTTAAAAEDLVVMP